jgi:hypothetical protein
VGEGKQKLTLTPQQLHDTFQPQQGRPQTLLARDRQVSATPSTSALPGFTLGQPSSRTRASPGPAPGREGKLSEVELQSHHRALNARADTPVCRSAGADAARNAGLLAGQCSSRSGLSVSHLRAILSTL